MASKLSFPLGIGRGQTMIENIMFNNNGYGGSMSFPGSVAHVLWSVTRFAPISPSSVPQTGLPLSFDIPSNIPLTSFFLTPLFAAYSADDTLCPITIIENLHVP
ncbi:hypothetical protein CEUSTIGMA_g6333.t1 [Chlamydomonas eustigma]|uniref:Uncharacterized protein n=1 Tax=Chlamydomonas eustigma TaxID=1157962 RepID=A0A250X736_9CHLO|nr:hypothetical protein CEUSTIGMA_g6333.t1 [Chlamydomonas eustigma]|eukprot:GAX78894.1 hypothetical protein CEUSTIGMA_g6333.t1 [Chlamydomonas eustigma]